MPSIHNSGMSGGEEWNNLVEIVRWMDQMDAAHCDDDGNPNHPEDAQQPGEHKDKDQGGITPCEKANQQGGRPS